MPEDDNNGELPPSDEQSDFYPNFPGSQQTAPSPLAAAAPGGPGGSLDALLAQRRKSVADMYDEAAKQLQASYRGPDTSELLLALGAGLLQPTASGSFGEAIGQGVQGMLPLLQQRHSSRDALNKELAGIRMNKAKDIGDLEEKYLLAAMKPAGGQPVWSESLGRFVPRGAPVVIKGGTLNGQRVESMSDGSMRVYDALGNFTVHDAGGRVLGQGGS